MKTKPSLKRSMFLIFITLIFLLSASTTVISLMKSFSAINIRTENEINYELLRNTDYIGSWLSQQKSLLETLTQETQIRKTYLNRTDMENYLAQRQREYPYVLSFYMGFADNGWVDSTFWVPESDFIPTQREWYQLAEAAEGIVITEPYVDQQTNQLVLTVAKKIMDGNTMVGVQAMDITMDVIHNFMVNSVTNIGSYAFVVNANGDVIMHPENYFTQKQGEFPNLNTDYGDTYAPLLKNIQSGNMTTVVIDDHSGIPHYFKHQVIPGMSWSVALSMPYSYLRDEVTNSFVVSLVIFVVMIIISLIVIKWYSDKYLKPIESVCNNLNLISQGELNDPGETVGANSKELQSLTKSIENMKETLTSYVNEIGTVMHALSDGDLTVHIPREYVGDFKDIRDSIITTLSSLNATFKTITSSASEIAYSANQVSDGATRLASGTAIQASSVKELADSISMISQNMQSSLTNAQRANEISTDAVKKLGTGNENMRDLLSAMNEIETKSNGIQKIIKTIEDIAFQTNILALNASVEASRAGEAGKGFAVVAEEVRNLAAKSAEAAGSTSQLIEGSYAAVQHGSRMADITAKTLVEVIEQSKSTSEIVDIIAGQAEEQFGLVENVRHGVEQISEVVKTNSKTSEESALASEELSVQSEMLKELILKFKL